jgi:hypothetical protein
MPLYVGLDLHSNNNFLAVINNEGKRIDHKKLPNDPKLILEALRPHQTETDGVVVESTYNWYWLVDTLMEAGYQVHLANPSAIQQYSGLKHTDDTKGRNTPLWERGARGILGKYVWSIMDSLVTYIFLSLFCGPPLNPTSKSSARR